MANETVQAVRQAELKAAQTEKEAVQKKEKILSEAHQNAKELISSMTKDALEKAEKELAAANRQGEKLIEAAIAKAQNEVIIMKEMVKSKEAAAKKLVLSCVIYDQ